jgi:hypothetical protein
MSIADAKRLKKLEARNAKPSIKGAAPQKNV